MRAGRPRVEHERAGAGRDRRAVEGAGEGRRAGRWQRVGGRRCGPGDGDALAACRRGRAERRADGREGGVRRGLEQEVGIALVDEDRLAPRLLRRVVGAPRRRRAPAGARGEGEVGERLRGCAGQAGAGDRIRVGGSGRGVVADAAEHDASAVAAGVGTVVRLLGGDGDPALGDAEQAARAVGEAGRARPRSRVGGAVAEQAHGTERTDEAERGGIGQSNLGADEAADPEATGRTGGEHDVAVGVRVLHGQGQAAAAHVHRASDQAADLHVRAGRGDRAAVHRPLQRLCGGVLEEAHDAADDAAPGEVAGDVEVAERAAASRRPGSDDAADGAGAGAHVRAHGDRIKAAGNRASGDTTGVAGGARDGARDERVGDVEGACLSVVEAPGVVVHGDSAVKADAAKGDGAGGRVGADEATAGASGDGTVRDVDVPNGQQARGVLTDDRALEGRPG